MKDLHNRQLNYLRISVTDRCNLRCTYCMPREHIQKLACEDILSYEEILRIASIAVDLGVNKIRVTGGEPLVRKGIYEFLKRLSEIPGVADLSLTTNGVLLKDNIDAIRSAGIRRINVSLDTLNREKYASITGRDCFPQVWDGIMAALKSGMHPIKLNAVAIRGINEDELVELARLSLTWPFHVRFIEYMPIGEPSSRMAPLLAQEIMDKLQELGELIPVTPDKFDGPAVRYRLKGAPGEIGFIRPISHHFCSRCNRLRLTASGNLRPCLLSDYQVDLKTPLRCNCLDDTIANLFQQAVRLKPRSHHINDSAPEKVMAKMSSIGG